jgi:hypothetical protein
MDKRLLARFSEILLGTLACWLSGCATVDDLGSLTREVESPDHRVRFTVPGSWDYIAGLNRNALIEVGNRQSNEYMVVFADSKSNFKGSLNDYVAIVTDDVRRNLPNATVDPVKSLTVNRRPALWTSVTAGGQKVRFLAGAIEGNALLVQVLCWAPANSNPSAFEGTFRRIMTSLIEKAPPTRVTKAKKGRTKKARKSTRRSRSG